MGDSHELFYTAAAQPSKLRWRPYERALCAVPTDLSKGKVTIIPRTELTQLQRALEDDIRAISYKAAVADDAVYNLAGQRVGRRSDFRNSKGILPAGVYVTQGKKLSIK